jgi:hypothetical protein
MKSGRVIAQMATRRPSSRRSKFDPMSSHVGFVVKKVEWGGFSPNSSVSHANYHSVDCSVFISYPTINAALSRY